MIPQYSNLKVKKKFDFIQLQFFFTRYYVQLPTEKAHEFHGELQLNTAEPAVAPAPAPPPEPADSPKERLDPRVKHKIRELVASGESNVYSVRKQLRSVAGIGCRLHRNIQA